MHQRKMSKYIAPNLRTVQQKVDTFTITDHDFPSFGLQTKQSVNGNGFKQTILNLIEREKLENLQRTTHHDPLMMSHAELYKNGWSVLSLRDVNLYSRFNRSVLTDVWQVPNQIVKAVPLVPVRSYDEAYMSDCSSVDEDD